MARFRKKPAAASRGAVGDVMSLTQHLSELRRRIVISVLAVASCSVGVLVFYDPILRFLQQPYSKVCRKESFGCTGDFLLTDPLSGIGTRMRISGWGGLVFALPIVLWQIWMFVVPALKAKEKRYAIPFVASSVVLFAAGASIAYLTLDKALDFLISWAGGPFTVSFTADKYIRLVILMMLAFGAGFLFPVLQVFLMLAGVVNTRQLLGWWRQAIVVIVGFAAVITPSGDPISLFALAGPMWVFYFVAIGIGHLLTRKRNTNLPPA